jgi:DNA gyrase/topoisomerase IV subunit A
MPIIPMVLVNGSEGIGTGWSSYIPNYNPRDIVANVRRLLNDEMMEPMDPWYRSFKVISLFFVLVMYIMVSYQSLMARYISLWYMLH